VLFAMLELLSLCTIAQAMDTGKTEKSRAIAIVFDNSGSMYQGTYVGDQDGPKAWCRATYATAISRKVLKKLVKSMIS
jgi:hypothetical protein